MARGLGRKLWLGLALVLAAVGASFLWAGYSARTVWRGMAAAVPADFAVDLGVAGVYSGPLSHSSLGYRPPAPAAIRPSPARH